MFPRWIRVLFAVEAVGLIALVVVGIHLVGDGARGVGDAISWAQPRVHLSGPLPSLSLPLPLPASTPTPAVTPRSPIAVIQSGNGLLDTLNGSTKTVTLGQIRILDELEQALRGYVDGQLGGVGSGH
jgi:hypothetical protein